jgi:hypothetical protein
MGPVSRLKAYIAIAVHLRVEGQRAIYSYDQRLQSFPSDANENIYSSEWSEHTKLLFRQFASQRTSASIIPKPKAPGLFRRHRRARRTRGQRDITEAEYYEEQVRNLNYYHQFI